MIQRTLLRQSLAIRSSIRSSPSTIARSQFRASPSISISSRQPIASSLTSRWYSSETSDAAKKEAETTAADGKDQPAAAAEEDASKKELEKKDREIIDLKDKLLRSVADFRNLQERTKRDMAGARDFAIQKFAKDLIESVDNFDRALGTVSAESLEAGASQNKELVSLYDGLKMTEGILMSTLRKHGLERFDPSVEGERFNPNEHEATFMTPMEGKTDGSVFHTQSKGFKLNGRVLRAAKVGVVKNS